jgi:RNA polymerase sigma-70 factor (ECF subfamily)
VDNLPAEIPSLEPAPHQQIDRLQQSQLLRSGLQQLSLEHRTVLELVFYQGLSLKEAAQVCGCPVGTVKSRLNYAKEHLRGVLRRQGLEAEELI